MWKVVLFAGGAVHFTVAKFGSVQEAAQAQYLLMTSGAYELGELFLVKV